MKLYILEIIDLYSFYIPWKVRVNFMCYECLSCRGSHFAALRLNKIDITNSKIRTMESNGIVSNGNVAPRKINRRRSPPPLALDLKGQGKQYLVFLEISSDGILAQQLSSDSLKWYRMLLARDKIIYYETLIINKETCLKWALKVFKWNITQFCPNLRYHSLKI